VVLFNDVVEVFALSQPHSARQQAFAFQRPYRGRISWILIDIDDPGIGLPDERNTLRKNRLAAAASRLAVSRKSIVCPTESTAR
jgi:hypothetical protein